MVSKARLHFQNGMFEYLLKHAHNAVCMSIETKPRILVGKPKNWITDSHCSGVVIGKGSDMQD